MVNVEKNNRHVTCRYLRASVSISPLTKLIKKYDYVAEHGIWTCNTTELEEPKLW